MKLFIISSLLLIASHLPNLSFGIKCWSCSIISGTEQCSEPLSLIAKDCNDLDLCLHEEYMANNSLHYLDCDIYEQNSFKEEIQCTVDSIIINGQSDKVYLRQCSCGTDLCNNPNKERIQCDSCYGNRKGINGDEPFNGKYSKNTAVTDFVCKTDEKPIAIFCPLDAPVCMIKWDEQHTKIGCGNHQIPKGQTTDCYYSSGVGECHCNTNRCNIDSLKELLPNRKPRTTTTESSANPGEDFSGNGNTEKDFSGNGNTEKDFSGNGNTEKDFSGNGNTEEDFSGNGNTEEDKYSPSSIDFSLILIIMIVVILVIIVALCIFAAIPILRRKNTQNHSEAIH